MRNSFVNTLAELGSYRLNCGDHIRALRFRHEELSVDASIKALFDILIGYTLACENYACFEDSNDTDTPTPRGVADPGFMAGEQWRGDALVGVTYTPIPATMRCGVERLFD